MRIEVVGLNHREAPVAVREALAFRRNRLGEALSSLRSLEGVEECVVLSTCNRVELYLSLSDDAPEDVGTRFLAGFHGVWPERFQEFLYRYEGEGAIRHLFRVASGLDSLVVGEAQVTAQVKSAYESASARGTTGPVLNRLFQQALAVAKRVRSTTEIGAGRASVGSVAVELAERIFESLADRTVLVLGAGEMGESVAESLKAAGARTTLVANRTFERAEALAARFGGKAVRFEQLAEKLARADIVIASTDAPHHVLRKGDVAAALRRRGGRPLFIIDIAVPRDVEPSAGDLEGCYLYNVDDLEAVVRETLARREREVARCEPIVEAEARKFMRWLDQLHLVPAIEELSSRLHALKASELEALMRRLPDLSEEARAEIERMANRLVNKILHQPIAALRDSSGEDRHRGLLDAALRLFGLRRSDARNEREEP